MTSKIFVEKFVEKFFVTTDLKVCIFFLFASDFDIGL